MSNVIDLELRVPQALEAIKIHQYQKYVKILNNVEDKSSEEAAEFLNLKSLEIFCGLTLKESYGLPVSMFESVIKQISNCFEEPTPLIQRFSMTGSDGVTVEFGFVPKLDEISLGEYIDVEKYISDWETMHKAIAVLYRPIIAGKKGFYLIEDYDGSDRYSDIMKDAPVGVALGMIVFFYRLGKKLSLYTMDYLQKQAQEMNIKNGLQHHQKDLERNGDGINQYMDLLKEMSGELNTLPSFHYINV
jgi:hypothetical protein